MKNKKAFTLIELLVAMAIIGILIALAIFGIIQVQRNSRETQRKKALEDINIGIQEYYGKVGQYPGNTQVVFSAAEVNIPSTASPVEIIPLNSSAAYGTPTNTNQTAYYYALLSDGYQLAACLENGELENAGTSNTEVTTSELTCN